MRLLTSGTPARRSVRWGAMHERRHTPRHRPHSGPSPTAPQEAPPRRGSVTAGETPSVPLGHGESDAKPSGFGDQIGPDQEDSIPDRAQPPFKPTGRKHRLPKPHQEVIEHAAGPRMSEWSVRALPRSDRVRIPPRPSWQDRAIHRMEERQTS